MTQLILSVHRNWKTSTFRVPESWDLKSGKIYLFASLLTGFLNYLFQLFAARMLSPQQFGSLNGWLADVSLFFMIGGVLQYVANFRPSSGFHLRMTLIVSNFLMGIGLAYWLVRPGALTLDRAILIILGSALFGWISGQLQTRHQFGVLSAIGLLAASGKLLIIALPSDSTHNLDKFAVALFASFIPALWCATYFLWTNLSLELGSKSAALTAPFLLSAASALTAQFDMILMHHTQSEQLFESFVQASIFSRAIYFLVFILSQWLLPRQFSSEAQDGHSGFPLIAAVGLGLSGAFALGSGPVGSLILYWRALPPVVLVFLSCAHTTLLALVFLRIQQACASKNTPLAAGLLGALAIEFSAQLVCQADLYIYLILVIAAQISLLTLSSRTAGPWSQGRPVKEFIK